MDMASASLDVMEPHYRQLQHQFGIDSEAYPYQLTTRLGEVVRLRASDGTWLPDIFIEIIGTGTFRLPWGSTIHEHPVVEWAARQFSFRRLRTRLTHTPLKQLLDALKSLKCAVSDSEDQFASKLEGWTLSQLHAAAANGRRDLFKGVREFYKCGVEEDLFGFDDRVLSAIDDIVLGTSDQGKLSVSMLSVLDGPYTVAELQQIEICLDTNSVATKRSRALVALCRDWGLRPIQLALLREGDFFFEGSDPYVLVPGVKGKWRSKLRRLPANMKRRLLTDRTADALASYIESNKQTFDSHLQALSDLGFKNLERIERPLFPSNHLNLSRLKRFNNDAALWPFALHCISGTICQELIGLTDILRIPNERAKRFAPEDDDTWLEISATRFRRTRGTSMALSGRTAEEVAEALDHLTVRSVQHYFSFNWDVICAVQHSFSESERMKSAVNNWTGRFATDEDVNRKLPVVKTTRLTLLGLCKREGVCPWHPTVTCYTCHSFRPDRHGDHAGAQRDIRALMDIVETSSTGPVVRQLEEAYINAGALAAATQPERA